MIEIQEINTREGLGGLVSDWNDLAERANPSLFLSHGWFSSCAEVLAPSQRLKVLALREAGKLTGIAPLLLRSTSLRHFPLKQVGFLDNDLTPFCDFLLLEPESGVRAIVDYLVKSGGFDLLRFNRMLPSSPNLPFLKRELERRGMTPHENAVAEVVVLRIAGDWDTFYNAKSRKFRMTRRSIANKIARLGEISVECAETPEQLKPALAAVLELSTLGWKRLENRDRLGEDVERRLLTSLVDRAAARQNVRIWMLRKDGDVIAAEFHLVDEGTAYGLRAQYDPQYFSHSPGRALDYEVVERLFKGGFATYDMGPGVAEYKRNWSDDTYASLQIEAFPRRLYPQLAAKVHYRLVPALKQTALGKWIVERGNKKVAATKSAEPEKPSDAEQAGESPKKPEMEKECPTVKSES
jgi:CelD/BcsL family acetyltransferase involved in cellulose biosynthesis